MNPNHSDKGCKATIDLPYPPIQTDCRRKDYAYEMLSNVGAGNSEMSAVSLYFYNSLVLDPEYGEFAQCFHNISIAEMHHLHIYASLASQMGLDPRLWCMQAQGPRYWTPAYNQYPRRVRELIEYSIRGEEDAIQKYTKQSQTICDENIVAILKRIILDEQHHLQLFHEMLAKVC